MELLSRIFNLLRQELNKRSTDIVNGFQNNTLSDSGLRHAAGQHFGFQTVLQILQEYENSLRQNQMPSNQDNTAPAAPAIQSVSLDPASADTVEG